MSIVILQEKLLGYASFLYLVCTALYILYLGKRSEKIGVIATSLGLVGCVIHTLGLALRWWAAGIEHPPFTDLYESLVFFGWGIVAFYLYMEWRHKVRIAGAFVFPVALAAMGIAVTHQKDIMPLPDALKSWWLHIHVIFASIAYAAFVVSFAFSLMYIIKDKTRREVLGAVSASLAGLSLFAVMARNGMRNLAVFAMKEAVQHQGRIMPVRISQSDYAYQTIPYVGPIFLVAVIAIFLSALFYIIRIYKAERLIEQFAGASLAVGFALVAVGLASIFYSSAIMENVSVRVEPFLISLLFFIMLVMGGMTMFHYLGDQITERLPDVEKLDFLGYRSVMVAFPLMTIVIVTGAVWAQSAWGRYWGWDPKETASFVTWLVYALYLHSRIVAGWKGKPAALISIIGFFSVIFTYLGVNVFLSGLHSYASSF